MVSGITRLEDAPSDLNHWTDRLRITRNGSQTPSAFLGRFPKYILLISLGYEITVTDKLTVRG